MSRPPILKWDGVLFQRQLDDALDYIETSPPSGLATVATTGAYSDLTGIPGTFTPATHTHALSDLTVSGASSGQVATWNGSAWAPATPAGSGQFRVPFHVDGSANITMTNQAVAAQFLANSNRNITKADLTNYTQVRLLARVVTGSASANTPRIYARYRTTYSTTVGDYLLMGATEVECSLTTAGLIDSGWINIVAGAKADVFLTVIQIGGDAAADPALGIVALDFK